MEKPPSSFAPLATSSSTPSTSIGTDIPTTISPPLGLGGGGKVNSFRRANSYSEHKGKGARRRSFDNLVYDDIKQRNPKTYDDVNPIAIPPHNSNSGRIVNVAPGEDNKGPDSSRTNGLSSARINSFVSEGGSHYSSGSFTDPDALFQKMCVESVKQIASKKKLTHMAAVDGRFVIRLQCICFAL